MFCRRHSTALFPRQVLLGSSHVLSDADTARGVADVLGVTPASPRVPAALSRMRAAAQRLGLDSGERTATVLILDKVSVSLEPETHRRGRPTISMRRVI